jgi:SAM-dependent methyltransferase
LDPEARRAHWENVWSSKAPDAVSWYQRDVGSSVRRLDATGLVGPATVLDVGGGASSFVDALLDRGFAPSVLDVSAAALEAAKKRLGERASKVEWLVADIADWTPHRTWDLWHDRAVYHFLVESDARAAYREALSRALSKGAHAILATFALDGPEKCSGLPVRRASAEILAADFDGVLELVESAREAHVTPWGSEQSFTWTRWRRV